MSGIDINAVVLETVRKCRTSNPFELARSLGIDLDYADLGGLKGFYIVYEKGRYIVINENLDERLMKLVAAHEIGHDCLHRDIAERGGLKETGFFDMKSKPEKEANIFAANLLISDREMLELAEEGYTIENIAKALGVHYQTALIKAEDMGKRGYEVKVPYVPKAEFLGGEV